jgi:single-strand DNA-binding protein
MADGLNRVLLLGNVGMDPELRMTTNGQAVLKLRLATSETYLDRNRARQERTEWHNVVVWGKRAEALAKFLSKGSRLFVEGSLRTSSYDDREGNKRYRTEVVATNIILAGGRAEGGGSRWGEPAPEREASPGAQSSGSAESYGDADYGLGDDDERPF